jgi:hypothetical protein
MNKQITDTSEMALDEVLLKLDETLKSERSLLQGTDFIFARHLIGNPNEVHASTARNYLRLVEELLVRRASPSEYVDAMNDGQTSDPQSGLHYMDAQQELSQDWNARHPRLQNGLPTGITNTTGWSSDQLNQKLEEVKRNLDWHNTTGSAEKWWKAFEAENITRLPLVLRLAEELQHRKATITEFFLAYVYSNTDNIQANLSYLDYTRLKKEEEKKKKEQAARALAGVEPPKPDSINNVSNDLEKRQNAHTPDTGKIESQSNELTFVRCQTCRTLVPASAKRCGNCNAFLANGIDASSAVTIDQSDDIRSLNLPSKVLSSLVRADISSIRDLTNKSVDELKDIPGIGQVAIDKIQDALKNRSK